MKNSKTILLSFDGSTMGGAEVWTVGHWVTLSHFSVVLFPSSTASASTTQPFTMPVRSNLVPTSKLTATADPLGWMVMVPPAPVSGASFTVPVAVTTCEEGWGLVPRSDATTSTSSTFQVAN